MSKKLPAMPWYVGDWLKDPVVRGMTFEERGFWFDLINIFWEMPERGRLAFKNGTAIPVDRLSRMMGAEPDYVIQKVTLLVNLGVIIEASDGVLEATRIRRDEAIRATRKEVGKLGGNPNLLKNNKSLVNQNANQKTEDESENEDENEIVKKKEIVASRSRSPIAETCVKGFDRFWSAYPKRDGKQDAVKAWLKLAQHGGLADDLVAVMLAAIERQKQTPEWTKDGGRFIPRASTWLNGRRWEDEGVVGIKPDAPWKKRYTDAMLPLDDEEIAV